MAKLLYCSLIMTTLLALTLALERGRTRERVLILHLFENNSQCEDMYQTDQVTASSTGDEDTIRALVLINPHPRYRSNTMSVYPRLFIIF
jgi:hypothetical protein